MSSTTNGMCGTEGPHLAARAAIQPFQGWGMGRTPTQGCAALALGFGIQPLRGSRSKSRRSPEVNGWSHIHGHTGDAAVVSIIRSGGDSTAFVRHSEVARVAPLMAEPLGRHLANERQNDLAAAAG